MCRKLVSAVVVGISFLGVFKCQYTRAFLFVLAGGLFGSFCAACNKVACGVIRFGDSIVLYCFATDFDKCVSHSVSVYFHIVLRVEYFCLC